MTEVLKRLLCWLFGNCWHAEQSRQATEALSRRVNRLERQIALERVRGADWRPTDVFRIG